MKNSRIVALYALLTACAITLSAMEGLLPPLPFLPPGAKAGLSNIVTLFAVSALGLWPAMCIALIKSMLVFATRGITAFFMSVAGGLLSTLMMWLCRRRKASFWLTGVAGAITHNSAQLAVAMALTATPSLIYYFPLLLLFALLAGSVTGTVLGITHTPLLRTVSRFIKK